MKFDLQNVVEKYEHLPLSPKQLFPRHVPLVTHMRQELVWPIACGMIGATAYPPAF